MIVFKKNRFALLLTLVLVVTIFVAGCSSTATPPVPPQPPVETVDEFALIAEAADAYLNSGKPPVMSAEDVYNAIVAEDPNMFILSVRSVDDDAKGRVPGSITIPYREMWKAENLAKLPKDKKIVVVCYTGHTASQVTHFLNLMGYEAYAMKFGMMGWTANLDVLNQKPFEKALGYPVETDKNELTESYELPKVETGFTTLEEIIAARAEAYWTNKDKSPVISAEDVYGAVVAEDPNMFILSVRAADDYAKGHVPGAFNIAFKQIAKAESLAKLPKDKKIVVVCYTGHTASQTTMLLNMLGYDAYAMKFGKMIWTNDAQVLNQKPFSGASDYPVE
jgi:sulfur-carrier protein adenylyltransferase/sulfurtransferase